MNTYESQIKKYVYAVYILQALAFLFILTAVIGLILNYVKAGEVRGSWLQSHVTWQKRTFWFGLLWIVLGTLTTPIVIGYGVLGLTTIWLVYRIAKGWIYLVDGKQLYL